ncbi:hypothetical protein C8R48DRAFT_678804 [Suillus tomentosus]|nr:hypothetical protein C8R48DRAFT_678804 [Suillus tomentosus]
MTQLRSPVNLVPRFGASADNRLTPYNSMEHGSQFWLKKYWDKNTTIDNGIKLLLLVSIPEVTDIHTMNKITSDELNCLVTHEGSPEASQLLGHLLSEIFQPFTEPLLDTSPDIPVPLYDTEAKTWNWALPVDPPGDDNSSLPSQVESSESNNPQEATHKEIFAAFLNALVGCLAVSQPKLVAMHFATSSWSLDLLLLGVWSVLAMIPLFPSRGLLQHPEAKISASIVPSKMLLPDAISDNSDESSNDSTHDPMQGNPSGPPTHDLIDEGADNLHHKENFFARRGLVGRGTICYLVTLDDEDYIIKDHWVVGKDDQVVLNKINMLELMDGVPGVPKLPCGHPLHMFRTLKEFVQALRDIVKRHLELMLSNRRLLIDWEFAVRIAADHKYPLGGTGTVAFMSRGLLNQVSVIQQEAELKSQEKKATQGHKLVEKPTTPKSSSDSKALPVSYVLQTFSDDLESLFVVFTYPTDGKCLIDKFHPYFNPLIMIHPVTFDIILGVLNSYLDKELVSTVNMLRNDAVILTHRVKGKQIASESFSVAATTPKRQKSRHGDTESDSSASGSDA